ncbi:MAG: acyltransferase [Halioglobus sp.]
MFLVLRLLRAAWRRLLGALFRMAASLSAGMEAAKLTMEPGVSFAVPVRVDGQGSVHIGKSCRLGFRLAPRYGWGTILLQSREPDAVISIGDNAAFSNNITIIARSRIELGEHCLVGDRVTIVDADFHEIDPDARLSRGGPGASAPVCIGGNCWIGSEAMILKGVSIGAGSIVAPKSVVTRSFPPRSIVGGNPAQLLRVIAS